MEKDPSNGGDSRSNVLTPEELDFTRDKKVAEIDDGRYVISSDGPPNVSDRDDEDDSNENGHQSDREIDSDESINESVVRRWQSDRLASTRSQYGFFLTAKFGSTIDYKRLLSNDVVTTFEQLLLWFAEQVDDETPVEEALGILLAEASLPMDHSAYAIRNALKSHQIDESDEISTLLETIESSGEFPDRR